MSNISSNTLFHFTPSLERLLGILRNEFQPHYCLEECYLQGDDGQRVVMFCIAIPMVCFCDIPLSQMRNHVDTYGSYGIGLSKDWGRRNKLNPVLYLTESARFSEQVNVIINQTQTKQKRLPNAFKSAVIDIVRHLKPYSGSLYREGKVVNNVRFYDEREWRFVPDVESSIDKLILSKEAFDDEKVRADYERKCLSKRLQFEPDDIRYLIVKGDNEISPLIDELRSIKKRYDARTVDVLASRIITSEQIRRDF